MRRFGLFTILSAILVGFLALATPSFAFSESGSHGWTKRPLLLRDGPGTEYAVTGQLPGLVEIKILRCQRLWCVVDGNGGRGWTNLGRVKFGLPPDGNLIQRQPRYPSGGPGQVCFFTGTNYTGQSFCAAPGKVFEDLALNGLDNHFSSVQLQGDVSVDACRDRFFQSYCERIITSQPVLDQYLVRNLTSVRAY